MTASSRLLVLSNPVAGKEEEYDRWYQDQHLPDVVAVPGVASAQRFTLAGDAEATHRFLAIYELDGDPAEVMAELRRRAGTDAMPMSDALDREAITVTVWAEHGSPVTAG